jgi:hypothetical protein
MTNKLNIPALETYSKIYARKTAGDFFSKQPVITGNQILTYSPMGQVNLFILHHLFAAWQEETARMQSPFFDYQTIEVQEALKQFMNTVSRHIAVRREHFEPLVNRAALSTLTLLLSPYTFVEDLLRMNKNGKVNIGQFKETGRYVQIHKPFYQALTDRLESLNSLEVPVQQAIVLLDEVYTQYQNQLEPASSYIDSFSQAVPLDENDLLIEQVPVKQPQPRQPEPAVEPLIFELDKREIVPEEIKPEYKAPVPEKKIPLQEQPTLPLPDIQVDIERFVKAAQTPAAPVVKTPIEPVPTFEPAKPIEPVKVPEPVKHEAVKPVIVSEKPVNLNEKFIREQTTLNDRLKQGPKPTLLDKHQKARIDDLKSVISLNQRFLFINELFKGDGTAFNQALSELEKCPDHQSAMDLVNTRYAATYRWDFNNEEVMNFLEIVERKFY